MASEAPPRPTKKKSSFHKRTPRHLLRRFSIFSFLCSLSYILGLHTARRRTSSIPLPLCRLLYSPSPSPLRFDPNHSLPLPPDPPQSPQFFPFCPSNFTHFCPCQGPISSFHRKRHCSGDARKLRCLVPAPVGYRRPFPWPKSRDYAWFSNVPFPRLAMSKKNQNWVRLEGDRLVFPGGGPSFQSDVKGYVDEISRVLPLKSSKIRTVLDVGCGLASSEASLMEHDILTMSIAPRDSIHEAQVQLALERGLPAMLTELSTHRLALPARSLDMAHCTRCLAPCLCSDYVNPDGLFLLEIDRVLRPGGYWVLSGPPMNHEGSWERTSQGPGNEQRRLEDLARRLCWKKTEETGSIVVWRKPTNHIHCAQKVRTWRTPKFCAEADDPDAGWYRKMDACITPLPKVSGIRDVSGGALEEWPKRLSAAPPRLRSTAAIETTIKMFNDENQLWKRRVELYSSILKSLSVGRYRNIMDMNAGIGGFAAALAGYPVWVMNVVPSHHSKNNTLGIIYERGLIGTYMNWCEPFLSYPRTYDLIHADGLFSMYMDKCDITDILFEMHRLLRPHGAVVIRDQVDTIVKVKGIMEKMRWKGKVTNNERGPFHPEKILFIDNFG
ncbi:probable methyltransferase PMT19 [Diospyros lotus]|uniref:probable methyltransferase PMT19 n=1 Tax=Diospyros lotus TaxID=55363 RepID=UPI00225891DC|nr:probable methyltransferase PMT19 [Diospyros lotus]